NGVSVSGELLREVNGPLHGLVKGRNIPDLRADVDAYAGNAQMLVTCGPAIKPARLLDGHAKLVLAQAGGDIRVRLRGNIGGHAQRDGGGFAQLAGAFRQEIKFAFTFNVKEKDAMAKRQLQFSGGLAHAGKDNSLERTLLRPANPFQFAAGNNVKAGSHPR